MSGQRHLRLAALIIGALGAVNLLWLLLDVVRAAAPAGWWLEAAFYALLILVAVQLQKGSELAWFGAVVIYGCAVVVGIESVLDIVLAAQFAGVIPLAQAALLLAAGVYGIWALLLSPRVKAFLHVYRRHDRFALVISLAVAIAVAAGIGWYLDRLSPDIQRTLAVQLGIAAAFAVLVAFLAARNRKRPVRWEFLPLVIAGVAIVANLETIGQLRELRPAAAAARSSVGDPIAQMPPYAAAMTQDLETARQHALAQMEAQTTVLGPWPLMEVLTPQKIADPKAVADAAATLDAKTTAIHDAVKTYDTILGRFAEQRRKIIAPLAEPVRRRVEVLFAKEEDAYRSHYGARVNLLSRAGANLAAMLRILKAQQGRYTADWTGAVTFEDTAAGEDFAASRAALEELVVWNSRLRAEGADLSASKPASNWLAAVH